MGQFKNNNLDGYGIKKFSNGEIYYGQFKENKLNG
jgi:hypothetical protein